MKFDQDIIEFQKKLNDLQENHFKKLDLVRCHIPKVLDFTKRQSHINQTRRKDITANPPISGTFN